MTILVGPHVTELYVLLSVTDLKRKHLSHDIYQREIPNRRRALTGLDPPIQRL